MRELWMPWRDKIVEDYKCITSLEMNLKLNENSAYSLFNLKYISEPLLVPKLGSARSANRESKWDFTFYDDSYYGVKKLWII